MVVAQSGRSVGADYLPIDVTLFHDSIHHWQMKEGRDRRDARFGADEVVSIADNLLKFQNADGGWPTNLDWLARIDVDEVRRIRNGTLGASTFDNRNTYSQIDYLAKAYQATRMPRFREAARRGLEYVQKEQRPTGGWRGKDVDAITFNDDVMTGVMSLLLAIRQDASQFEWLDQDLRADLAQSLDRALDATLKCQIVVNGQRTAWCQQHDHRTFAPVRARTYELPSLTAQESAGVVELLMRLPDPSVEVCTAVESAIAWFQSAKIESLRVKTVPIEPVRFEGFTATFDRVTIHDSKAPPIWARFYDLETNRPFFCNRDGIRVERLAEVQLERRVGYGWYGYWPAQLLADLYPKWKSRSPGFQPGK